MGPFGLLGKLAEKRGLDTSKGLLGALMRKKKAGASAAGGVAGGAAGGLAGPSPTILGGAMAERKPGSPLGGI